MLPSCHMLALTTSFTLWALTRRVVVVCSIRRAWLSSRSRPTKNEKSFRSERGEAESYESGCGRDEEKGVRGS
jgi:hypothetical protein